MGGLECKKAWVAKGVGCAQEAPTSCDSRVNDQFGHICQCRAPVDSNTVITMEVPVASEEIGEFVVGTIMQQEATRCYHEYVQQYSAHTGAIQLLEPPHVAVLPLQSYRRLYGAAVASTVEVGSQIEIEADIESATDAAVICEAHCQKVEAEHHDGKETPKQKKRRLQAERDAKKRAVEGEAPAQTEIRLKRDKERKKREAEKEVLISNINHGCNMFG